MGSDAALILEERDYDRSPVICLEGNGARPSHMGNGYSDSDVMYTLNTIEKHSVCYNRREQHDFVLFIANRYAEYKEGLPTLRASGGDTGGGGEGLIVFRANASEMTSEALDRKSHTSELQSRI